MEQEVDALLRRKYETSIRDISIVEREDLDLVRKNNFMMLSDSAPAKLFGTDAMTERCANCPYKDLGFKSVANAASDRCWPPASCRKTT